MQLKTILNRIEKHKSIVEPKARRDGCARRATLLVPVGARAGELRRLKLDGYEPVLEHSHNRPARRAVQRIDTDRPRPKRAT